MMVHERMVAVGVFPIGIEPHKFEEKLETTQVQDRIKELEVTFAGKKVCFLSFFLFFVLLYISLWSFFFYTYVYRPLTNRLAADYWDRSTGLYKGHSTSTARV